MYVHFIRWTKQSKVGVLRKSSLAAYVTSFFVSCQLIGGLSYSIFVVYRCWGISDYRRRKTFQSLGLAFLQRKALPILLIVKEDRALILPMIQQWYPLARWWTSSFFDQKWKPNSFLIPFVDQKWNWILLIYILQTHGYQFYALFCEIIQPVQSLEPQQCYNLSCWKKIPASMYWDFVCELQYSSSFESGEPLIRGNLILSNARRYKHDCSRSSCKVSLHVERDIFISARSMPSCPHALT